MTIKKCMSTIVHLSQYGIEAAMPKAQGGTGDKVLVRGYQSDKDRRKTQELIEGSDH
ncbi:hypothetical protein AABD41_00030 [Staphylococcus pseudoxylosus]|uniref:hypothetical protein n=1 Tax=Staphylococcus pseudoxylosus TaxID=2282419 RepID=UPI00398B9933